MLLHVIYHILPFTCASIVDKFSGCRSDLSWYCRLEVSWNLDEVRYSEIKSVNIFFFYMPVILVINNLSFCVDAYKAWWITVGTCSMNVLTRSYWSWFSKPWITQIDLFGKRDTMCVLLWCPLGSRIKVGAWSFSVPCCWFRTVLYLQQYSLWMSYNFCTNSCGSKFTFYVYMYFSSSCSSSFYEIFYRKEI